MTSYSASVGATPTVISGSLTWSPNGTLRQNSISDGYNSADTQVCTYLYDDFIRVAGTTSTPGVNCLNGSTKVWNQTFTYDQFGNITKTSTGPGLQWACAACYNTANNQYNSTLSASIAYDAAGNLLNDTFHTYTWNAYGHVATIVTPPNGSTTSAVTYDANDNKVEENVGGTIREYVSAFGVNAEMVSSQEFTTTFDLPGGVQALYSPGGLQRFRFPDWQGSIRAESNSATRAFTESLAFAPFGERYAVAGAPYNVDSFTGKPDHLVSDEYDFPARQEHNGQGRWVSPDPMRGTGNKYVYADNNPLSKVDVYGLETVTIVMNGLDLGVTTLGEPEDMQLEITESHPPSSTQTSGQSPTTPDQSAQNTHTITVVEVQGQQGNPANHIVVSVDGQAQVGFGPAKDLTKKQIVKEATGIDNTGTPGKVEPRAAGVKTLDQVTVHVTADQAAHAQTIIDQRSSSPGNYHVTIRNCAEFGEDVLRAGGVRAPTAAVPGELMMELHVEQSLGVAPQ